MNPALLDIIGAPWHEPIPPPPYFQRRVKFVLGSATHRFASHAAVTVGAKSEASPAFGAATISGGSGTVAVVDVISSAAAIPASAPDGGDANIGAGDGGQGGLGYGGAPDTPDADTGGLGTAAVGFAYAIRAEVVLQGAGTLLPVQSFVFDVPAGGMGSSLRVVLADPRATVNEDDRIRVRIGIADGGRTEWLKLVGGARITEINNETGYLSDRVSFTAVNPMADRWARSPRRPLVLYDPAQTTLISVSASVARDIVDSERVAITPEFRVLASLDLHQLMQFVYIEKCGFSRVITNIDNYSLKRCDFTIEATWHSVVASEIGAFEPVYGSDDDDVLFILDPQGALPDDLPATLKKLKPRAYSAMASQRQVGGMVNAVILNYRDNSSAASEFSGAQTDRFTQHIEEAGSSGEAGWHRTVENRFIKDFHDNPNDPTDVTRSIIWKTDTRVSAMVGGFAREVSIESQTDFWTSDWRLKVGYEKIVQAAAKLPGETVGLMREVQREYNRVVWEASQSRPGEMFKVWEVTQVTGTVLSTDTGDPENPELISLYDANRTNSVSDDQTVELTRPISTVTERFRDTAEDQLESKAQKINQLIGVLDRNQTFQHTGTTAVRIDPQQITARMLITNTSVPDEEARPPLQFNAGNIPFASALPLAQRLLDRRGSKPRTITFELAGLDLTLRRGTLRRIFTRDGQVFRTFITGYTVKGDPGPNGTIILSMSGTGVVIG